MRFEEAQLTDGISIRFMPEKKLGEGSQKEFFETENKNLVIGFYKDRDTKQNPERIKRLTRIIEKYNPTLDHDKGQLWKKQFCWPKATVVKPRLGILSPKYPALFYFLDGKGEKKAKWFSNSRLVNKLDNNERGDWFKRIMVCRQLALAIGRMHSAGLAHSDLSSSNVLMDLSSARCIVTDIDSLVVPGVFPPEVIGTKGYMAPEIFATSQLSFKSPKKNLPCIKSDLHSLAVIIYETLLLRHPLEGKTSYHEDPLRDDFFRYGEKALFIENPIDTSNRPEKVNVSFQSLGPHLSSLFLSSFVDGLHDPEERPTAFEWAEALTKTIDLLYPCQGTNCPQKWFVHQSGSKPECPFCGWKIPERTPIMRLFRMYRNGQYISEKHYVSIWDRKKIYAWHTRSDIPYPTEISSVFGAKGSFTLQNSKWFLRNESRERMVCSNLEQIKPGGSLEIYHGKVIILSRPPEGRVARFEF